MAVGTTTGVRTVADLRSLRSLPYRQRLHHPAYWQWLRFLTFGRALPAVLFGWMGFIQFRHLQANVAALHGMPSAEATVVTLLPNSLYLLFCSIPVVLYLTRPQPQRRDGRFVARATAFTGTLMQLVVGAVLPVGPALLDSPAWVHDLSSVVAVAGFSLALCSLGYLRRNLSIIPEARRLTTAGPYRLVRHPLYFAEILAAASVVLATPAITPLCAFVAFVVVQNLRATFEERLLLDTFPEYRDYRERTHRLLPFLW